MKPIVVSPSILSADFSRLGELVREVEAAGAGRIHVDVMDGHFVPNLSMGPVVVQGLRPVTKLPLEVHLMVTDPGQFVEPFAKAGSNVLIGHHEVLPDPRPFVRQVRAAGNWVGLAINPATPVEVVDPYLPEIDVVLCMTVHPGYGGQAFIPASLERVRKLRDMVERRNPNCLVKVDGGINLETGRQCVAAGATILVAGSAVFNAPEGPAAAVRALRGLAV